MPPQNQADQTDQAPAPKVINLPDGTQAQFPHFMEDSAIQTVLQRQFPTRQNIAQPPGDVRMTVPNPERPRSDVGYVSSAIRGGTRYPTPSDLMDVNYQGQREQQALQQALGMRMMGPAAESPTVRALAQGAVDIADVPLFGRLSKGIAAVRGLGENLNRIWSRPDPAVYPMVTGGPANVPTYPQEYLNPEGYVRGAPGAGVPSLEELRAGPTRVDWQPPEGEPVASEYQPPVRIARGEARPSTLEPLRTPETGGPVASDWTPPWAQPIARTRAAQPSTLEPLREAEPPRWDQPGFEPTLSETQPSPAIRRVPVRPSTLEPARTGAPFVPARAQAEWNPPSVEEATGSDWTPPARPERLPPRRGPVTQTPPITPGRAPVSQRPISFPRAIEEQPRIETSPAREPDTAPVQTDEMTPEERAFQERFREQLERQPSGPPTIEDEFEREFKRSIEEGERQKAEEKGEEQTPPEKSAGKRSTTAEGPMPERFTPVESSMMKGYSYDPAGQKLEIMSRGGGIHEYSKTPEEFNAFKKAGEEESWGKAFNQQIKRVARRTIEGGE